VATAAVLKWPFRIRRMVLRSDSLKAMKTILLKDEETICIELPEGGDDSADRHFHFVFPAAVCAAIDLIVVIWDDPSYTASFEPGSVCLPKLTGLACCDGSFAVFECLLNIIDVPAVEGVGFMGAGIRSIPEEIFLLKSLQSIDISNKVPYSVPDGIRNLVNLERFNAEFSPIDYLSPELFRLPRIRHLNFEFSSYVATPEVLVAAEEFVAAGGFLRLWNEAGPASKLPATLTDGVVSDLQLVQSPSTSDLAQKPPSVKQGTDEGSPLTEAFVPANDPKQKLGVRQRAIFTAEWAAGLVIATVLCPFVSPVFALFLAFHILDGMRTLPLVLKFPLGIIFTIVLIPVMLIPAWGICAVLGHEMVSTPACRACGGKIFKDVQFITDKEVLAEMVDRELKIGEIVCANCGKNFRNICA